MSFLKEGPFYSIVHSKCSKCNLGDLYVDNHPYHLRSLGKMRTHCEVCGQRYEPETGFYYGAMYVSYALSVAIIFIPAYIMYMFFDASVRTLMITIIGIYVFTFPLMFRWSRNIWLNIFVKFDPEVKKQHLNAAGEIISKSL